MYNSRDFLPEKYLSRFQDGEDLTVVSSSEQDLKIDDNKLSIPKFKRSNRSKKVVLLAVIFLFLSLSGVAALMILINQNQDNRQQAFDGGPYVTASPTVSVSPSPTAIPTVVITSRPNTESTCLGEGFWLNNTCYLNGEVLPGGTHIVISPEQSSYAYSTLMTIEKAEELGLLNPEPEEEQVTDLELDVVNENNYLTVDISLSDSLKGCVDPFYVENNKCVPDQKSDLWNSDWINNNGCGAMQALYYALNKDPNIDPQEFLNEYYPEYLSGEKIGNTYDHTNVEILNDLGYVVEPFPKSLVYSSEAESEKGNTFFVKGVFENGVNHYFSIDNVYTNEQGRTVFETVDSYYNVDKCVSTGDTMIECFDSSNNYVTSLDLSNQQTSVYLVVDDEKEEEGGII